MITCRFCGTVPNKSTPEVCADKADALRCAWMTNHPHISPEDRKVEQLRTALAQLSNEVLGSLPLMEPLARREFGNTNYALLIQRAEEAQALLNEQ